MTPNDWKLILLALGTIVVLVLLITRFKVNAFVALLGASLLVGAASVAMSNVVRDAAGKVMPYTMIAVVNSFSAGLGATLGGITAVIGLGTMLGKLLAESGGADVLAVRFAAFFGPKRVQWCVMFLALAVGLTTWFAVGLVLLLPIVLTLTRETKQPFLRLALPFLACLSVMHGLMPPHPGPVVAVDALKGSMGHVLFWGFVVGLPTVVIAGPLFAWWLVPRMEVAAPGLVDTATTRDPGLRQPGFGLTLVTIFLPVLLMLMATVTELVLPKGDRFREAAAFAGNPTMALLVSVLFASWSLGIRCGYTRARVWQFTEQCIAAVGMTILIVGGGGGFARVLRDSGVADSIGRAGEMAHLPPIFFGWLVAAFIRVATGSATVAITTASGLLVPVLALHPEYSQSHVALIIVAMGCGSLFLSHLNDGGFWIVKDYLGMSVNQTLKTWTICETIIGIAGMIIAVICFYLV